jgi:hypothetical protein
MVSMMGGACLPVSMPLCLVASCRPQSLNDQIRDCACAADLVAECAVWKGVLALCRLGDIPHLLTHALLSTHWLQTIPTALSAGVDI